MIYRLLRGAILDPFSCVLQDAVLRHALRTQQIASDSCRATVKSRPAIARLRAKESLNAAEVKICADYITKLWTGQRNMYNSRIRRVRMYLDSIMSQDADDDGEKNLAATTGVAASLATTTGDAARNLAATTGVAARAPGKEREAERGSTPTPPLRRKGKGKKLRSHFV